MQMKPIKKKTRAPKLPSGRIFDEISRLLPQQGISGADHANGAKSACSPFSRRSAPPFLAFRCDLGVSYILLTGDRGFESISLQRRVMSKKRRTTTGEKVVPPIGRKESSSLLRSVSHIADVLPPNARSA